MRMYQFAAFAALFAACAGTEPIDVKPGGYEPAPIDACAMLESAPFMTWQMVVRWQDEGCAERDSVLFVDETDQLDDSASLEVIEAVLP